jgi:hypothetical protein
MMTDTKKQSFWRLSLPEILSILCAAAIPIALAVYTGITYAQEQKRADQMREFDLKQATELRQQAVYDQFLDDMYNLSKDGHLDEKNSPWAFANAYYRVAHRQWDTTRNGDVLLFLKEKELIGKLQRLTKRSIQKSNDIIRLNGLSFDNVHLKSETDLLILLNMKYIAFDQVSMVNARFAYVDLDETSFNWARLNQAKFQYSSLVNATFDSTQLRETDFGNSNLRDTRFLNVDLSTAKLTNEQLQQAIFINTTLPNGTLTGTTTTGELLNLFLISSTNSCYLILQ